MSLKSKERLVEELNKQLHDEWEATPENPFLEIPESCLDVMAIVSADMREEIDFEIVNDIINKAKSLSGGFTNWREKEQDLANAILGGPPIERGDPKQFKWSEIQGLT